MCKHIPLEKNFRHQKINGNLFLYRLLQASLLRSMKTREFALKAKPNLLELVELIEIHSSLAFEGCFHSKCWDPQNPALFRKKMEWGRLSTSHDYWNIVFMNPGPLNCTAQHNILGRWHQQLPLNQGYSLKYLATIYSRKALNLQHNMYLRCMWTGIYNSVQHLGRLHNQRIAAHIWPVSESWLH